MLLKYPSKRTLTCLVQSTIKGKKHWAVWACIRRKSCSDNFYFLWESRRWLLEIENDKKKKKKCLKMSGKRWYFQSVDYCLLVIWIDNKSFGQLEELTCILFEDSGLSTGLSRDPRKNWCGRSLFSRAIAVEDCLVLVCKLIL